MKIGESEGVGGSREESERVGGMVGRSRRKRKNSEGVERGRVGKISGGCGDVWWGVWGCLADV